MDVAGTDTNTKIMNTHAQIMDPHPNHGHTQIMDAQTQIRKQTQLIDKDIKSGNTHHGHIHTNDEHNIKIMETPKSRTHTTKSWMHRHKRTHTNHGRTDTNGHTQIMDAHTQTMGTHTQIMDTHAPTHLQGVVEGGVDAAAAGLEAAR